MIILILSLLFQNTIPVVQANNTPTYFAKVMLDETYLHKTPELNSNSENVYFQLPKTYFVELIENTNEFFYKARYLHFYGYVKKDSVQAVSTTPSCPFLENVSFRVYADMSRSLMSNPNTSSTTSNLVATIPLYTKNLTYYGSIVGETLIEGRTNIWYYCKYSADKDYYGYVYSDFCDNLSPIKENTEEVTFINNPTFKPEEKQPTTIPPNNNIVGIIIGILCIPALIFAFMIIKSKNILTRENLKNKEIIDY